MHTSTPTEMSLHIDKFRELVDFLAQLFKLDPNLPELIRLKERALDCVSELSEPGSPRGMFWLMQINPMYRTRADGIGWHHTGNGVLYPATVARAVYAMKMRLILDDRITRIIITNESTLIFTKGNEKPTFIVTVASLHPMGIVVAQKLIEDLTGLQLTLQPFEFHAQKQSVVITRDSLGGWIVEQSHVATR